MSLPDRSLSCTLIHKCNEVSLPLSLSYRSNLHLPNSGLLAISLAARAIKAILNLLLDVDHDHFIKELRDLLYPVWQNQSFEIHQRCKKGTLLSRKLINGQAAVHQWCATLAYPTLSVSSRNLENQHTNTVNDFISIWVCLDQVIRFVVTSLGDNSRGLPDRAGSWSNVLAKGTAPSTRLQIKSWLLTTLQVQMHFIYLIKVYVSKCDCWYSSYWIKLLVSSYENFTIVHGNMVESAWASIVMVISLEPPGSRLGWWPLIEVKSGFMETSMAVKICANN